MSGTNDDQQHVSSAQRSAGIVFKRDKGHFTVSSTFIQSLAHSKVDFTVMMTYMLLARGVGQLDDRRTTTTNSAFVVAKTQWDEERVNKAISWLQQNDYIELVDVVVNKERNTHWLLKDKQQDIILPNTLIDGGAVSPLIRLYSPRILSEEEDLRQIDHLIVLCMLYYYNDMSLFGGVNPRIGLYRKWLDFNPDNNVPVLNMMNSDAAIYAVKGRTEVFFEDFVHSVFTYIHEKDERLLRIGSSLQRLILSGFIYETAQIWDSDPFHKAGEEAIPLYTLYVHDPISNTDAPALQKMIQRVAYRLGVKDGYDEFTQADYEKGINVKFHYVADKQAGGYPLGVFRLKFYVSMDNEGSADAESVRAAAWLRELQVLNYLRD